MMASSIFPGLQLQLKICDFFGTTLPRSNYVHLKKNANVKPLLVEARANTRTESAKIRDRRLKEKFNGTPARPRLSVFCSDKHLYAMLVDDQQKKCLFYASTLQQSIRKDSSCSTIGAPSGGPPSGKKRRIMANGVQKTLSKTSMLINFLPTGTLLTFEMVLPSVYGKGECSHVTTVMIHVLLGLCTLSCFFFHFTDSFKGPDGKIYYGFVTTKGLAVFKHGLEVQVPKDERYRVGFTDFVHALMSVLVFVAIAFSDHRVTNCLFPGHAKEIDEVMRSFPLMVGVICSGLFLVFPNTRYGIGCMTA